MSNNNIIRTAQNSLSPNRWPDAKFRGSLTISYFPFLRVSLSLILQLFNLIKNYINSHVKNYVQMLFTFSEERNSWQVSYCTDPF